MMNKLMGVACQGSYLPDLLFAFPVVLVLPVLLEEAGGASERVDNAASTAVFLPMGCRLVPAFLGPEASVCSLTRPSGIGDGSSA